MAKQKNSTKRGKDKAHARAPHGKPFQRDETSKARSAFSKVRRELSDEELSSASVVRLLLDTLERLERQVTEVSKSQERSHQTDIQKAVLEERIRKSIASDIMFGLSLTIGAMLIGLTFFLGHEAPSADLIDCWHTSSWRWRNIKTGGKMNAKIRAT